VREFEEQMAALRKENFNLKLRIYFLEEKPAPSSSTNSCYGSVESLENVSKQNIDLKVKDNFMGHMFFVLYLAFVIIII
jgi:centrosomin